MIDSRIYSRRIF